MATSTLINESETTRLGGIGMATPQFWPSIPVILISAPIIGKGVVTTILQCIASHRPETHFIGHSVPVLVEVLSIVGMHAFEVIVRIEIILAHFLLYHFPAPVIEHSLMRRFLDPSLLIFIHLLPVHYSVAVAHNTMCLCTVDLILWPSISVLGHLLVVCLFNELALAKTARIHVDIHLPPHVAHHLVHLLREAATPKARIAEKGIILERIIPHHTSKSGSYNNKN